MKHVLILVLPGILLILAQGGCQGEKGGFSCLSDDDCPPACECDLSTSLTNPTCKDNDDVECGGSCDLTTTCPEGTSCRFEPTSGSDLRLFACLPPPGGTGGTGGTGGALSGTITGEVLDRDNTTGLAGVFVRAILNDAGAGSDTTESAGFEIPVSRAGDYELCAIGVLADEQRWVSTDCEGAPEDAAMVTESTPDVEQDLNVTTGYYLEIIIEPSNISVGPTTTLTLDYQAWNRLSVPNGTTWIVLGIEGSAQGAYEVGNAGLAPGKTEVGVSVQFTPASTGTIFARLIPEGTEKDARDQYRDSFDNAETTNYVPIGEVE